MLRQDHSQLSLFLWDVHPTSEIYPNAAGAASPRTVSPPDSLRARLEYRSPRPIRLLDTLNDPLVNQTMHVGPDGGFGRFPVVIGFQDATIEVVDGEWPIGQAIDHQVDQGLREPVCWPLNWPRW